MPIANPIFDLGNPVWVEVVAVAQTPSELRQYAGRMLSVANTTTMPPLGTRGIVVVSGVSVPGYLRTINGEYQWVVMPPVDPMDALVDSIPGLAGWTDTDARDTWISTGLTLRGLGVSQSDLDQGLPWLYDAARTNVLLQQETGPA